MRDVHGGCILLLCSGAGGLWCCGAAVGLSAAIHCSQFARSSGLQHYPETHHCSLLPQPYWVWAYAIMVGSILLISFARSYLFYMAALRASTRLHAEVAERVSLRLAIQLLNCCLLFAVAYYCCHTCMLMLAGRVTCRVMIMLRGIWLVGWGRLQQLDIVADAPANAGYALVLLLLHFPPAVHSLLLPPGAARSAVVLPHLPYRPHPQPLLQGPGQRGRAAAAGEAH